MHDITTMTSIVRKFTMLSTQAFIAHVGIFLNSHRHIFPGNYMVCCFLGFLCIVCSSVHFSNFRGSFYNTCVIVAFICTLLVLLARLFQLWQRKFLEFNAVKCELYLHTFLAFISFTAGCVTISLDVLSYTIATFFAFLAFSFYAFDAYMGYRLNRLCDAQTQTQPQPPV